MKCYCGFSKDYDHCCGKFHKGIETPKTPEELMRSRYSAFCVKDFEYLAQTHDPQTFHREIDRSNREWPKQVQFIKLEIIHTEESGNKGLVEFKAYFKLIQLPPHASREHESKVQVHHEKSLFRKQGQKWLYRDQLSS